MVLAHIITWKTDSYVYGGFIRNFILRQDLYDDSDLDVSLNADYNYNYGSTMYFPRVPSFNSYQY